MDSLLATYASSSDDEEEQHHHHSNSNHNHHETSSFSTSLEPSSSSSSSSKFVQTPKTSSSSSSSTNLFNLPQPKSSSSSLFSSMLPPPKSNQPNRQQPSTNLSSSHQNPKKIVQFRPPLNPSLLKTLNDEDSDEEEEEKSRKPTKVSSTETSSVASFFSSLPAPKSSLGLGSGSSLGAGRKSIVETNVLPSSNSNDSRVEKNKKNELSKEGEFGNGEGNLGSGSSSTEALVSGGDGSNWVSSNESYGSYENYGGYVNYENSYGTYEGTYGGSGDMASTTMGQPTIMTPEISRAVENVARSQGKRGRNEIPTEIIEVKQDELMKNRPREDQAKVTGIAFGPAYQPASSKGKPSKLHKRKHQIGALYFDMRQKEMELAERRSKGFLTKAETQAKYGW